MLSVVTGPPDCTQLVRIFKSIDILFYHFVGAYPTPLKITDISYKI